MAALRFATRLPTTDNRTGLDRLGVEGVGMRLIPSVQVLGQEVAYANRQIRGNEDLGEVRLGLRAGGPRWMRIDVVTGYEPTSPALGAILWVGVIR